MAVEMHRHQRLRPLRHHPVRGLRGQVEGEGIDVGEDGARPGAEDGQRGEGGGERRGDHLVAGTHAQGLEGELEGLGAVGHRHAVRGTHARGQLRLEGLDLGAQDEAARVQHARHRGVDLRPHGLEGAAEVQEGNARVAAQR